MRILLAGGSGFLGRALTHSLTASGHHVTILTRRAVAPGADSPSPSVRLVQWSPDGQAGPWTRACANTDIVINLAGESIAARRWTTARKLALAASRVLPTRSLVHFIEHATPRPTTLVSASAIGFYGDRGDQVIAEEAREGADILAEIAGAWEREAQRASSDATRVVVVRTGIVLDPHEGALAKLLTPFRLLAGGPFGSGRQYMSWIHRDDWVSLATWLVETPGLAGAFNATAPHPVTNAEFARTLGRVLGRPAFARVPGSVLRIVLGEMAGPLLLASQRVIPAKAQQAGFRFAYPDLEAALRQLLGRS
jgi:uncharacterized protein